MKSKMTNSESPKTATPTPKTSTPKKASKAKDAPTLADLCRRYIQHMEKEGKSPGTVSSYTAELKLACKHLGAETRISAITANKVQAYFEGDAVTKLRSGKPKAKPSIDKTRRVLRLALAFAVSQKLIAATPIPEPATNA